MLQQSTSSINGYKISRKKVIYGWLSIISISLSYIFIVISNSFLIGILSFVFLLLSYISILIYTRYRILDLDAEFPITTSLYKEIKLSITGLLFIISLFIFVFSQEHSLSYSVGKPIQTHKLDSNIYQKTPIVTDMLTKHKLDAQVFTNIIQSNDTIWVKGMLQQKGTLLIKYDKYAQLWKLKFVPIGAVKRFATTETYKKYNSGQDIIEFNKGSIPNNLIRFIPSGEHNKRSYYRMYDSTLIHINFGGTLKDSLKVIKTDSNTDSQNSLSLFYYKITNDKDTQSGMIFTLLVIFIIFAILIPINHWQKMIKSDLEFQNIEFLEKKIKEYDNQYSNSKSFNLESAIDAIYRCDRALYSYVKNLLLISLENRKNTTEKHYSNLIIGISLAGATIVIVFFRNLLLVPIDFLIKLSRIIINSLF